jgi:phage terminase small subunit
MTPPPSKQARLTPRQERFVDEYLIDLNATQAAIRAGYSAKTAEAQASRLLRNVKVAEAVQRAKGALAERVQIKAANVLQLIWDTATADPRELIEQRRGACRYCHGQNFDYQRTPAEMRRARLKWDNRRIQKATDVFEERGGVGYNPTKPPHPDCPECFGEGNERTFVHDTRNLSRSALALYAGVKVTKDGIEVKVHDQQAARITVGKHLGLFKEQEEPEETEEERIKRLRAGLRAMDEQTLGKAVVNEPQ